VYICKTHYSSLFILSSSNEMNEKQTSQLLAMVNTS
jgi:hypothetical protein